MKGAVALLIDTISAYGAVQAALYFRFDGDVPLHDLREIHHLLPLLFLARLGAFYAAGIYRRSFVYPRGFDYADLIQAWAAGTVILSAAVFFGRMLETSRLFLVYESVFFLAAVSIWRGGAGLVARSGASRKPAVYIGTEAAAERVERFLVLEGWEYKITRRAAARDWNGPEEAIFVPREDFRPEMQAEGKRLFVIPEIEEILLSGAEPYDLGGLVVLDAAGVRRDRHYLAAKRAMDCTAALAGLLLFAPIMIAVAGLIRLTSPGSALFLQKRAGQGGRTFAIYKFRTMRSDKSGPRLTEIGDDRVTKIGKFLRQWSIDELPQLVNVLFGTMSLVGPRPELPEIVAKYPTWRRHVLEAAPGLTGLVQILGRDDLTDDEKARLDLYYAMNRSFEMDISIILRTFRAVIKYRGRT